MTTTANGSKLIIIALDVTDNLLMTYTYVSCCIPKQNIEKVITIIMLSVDNSTISDMFPLKMHIGKVVTAPPIDSKE